ncbi:MAG: glycosyltransferase family 2 protein [Christensenellales bacterium]
MRRSGVCFARGKGETAMISIVMPCYNCETSLARTVRCVQAQTVSDWELIAVDDGSTDGTGAALDGLAQNDARIRAIHQANGGVSRARNIGMAAAGANGWPLWTQTTFFARCAANVACTGRRRGGYPLRRIYHSAYGRGWTRRSVGLRRRRPADGAGEPCPHRQHAQFHVRQTLSRFKDSEKRALRAARREGWRRCVV